MSLPIYMGTGTVALCKTDPVSWAQTLMPLHPVKAHFHKLFLRRNVQDKGLRCSVGQDGLLCPVHNNALASHPAWPAPPGPTHPWCVGLGFHKFPEMPCMKRAYRDKKGVGPLVSTQEEKALLVPVINK